jgi:hypothetical protein
VKPVRAATILLAVLCTPGTVTTLASCQLQGVCQASFFWYDDYLAGTTSTNIHEPLPPGSGPFDGVFWESGPVDGQWLDYPGERSIFLFPNLVPSATGAPPALQGNFPGPYANVFVQVSPNQDANATTSNWTFASGNLAEVTVVPPGPGASPEQWFIAVTNASCADYFVRVVVQGYEPDAGTLEDGGSDSGVPNDASTDGSVDAALD